MRADRRGAVAEYSASKFHYLGRSQSPHDERSRSESAAADAATRLTPLAGLALSLLLSLRRLAAILQTVFFLAAGGLRYDKPQLRRDDNTLLPYRLRKEYGASPNPEY